MQYQYQIIVDRNRHFADWIEHGSREYYTANSVIAFPTVKPDNFTLKYAVPAHWMAW